MKRRVRYPIVPEKADDGYSAQAPDLPGCSAAGGAFDETLRLMREAIAFHPDGKRRNGEPVPEPASVAECVEDAAL